MRAILVTEFGPPEVMQCANIDIPSITATQVLIRVEATSVNFADIKSRYGKKGSGKLPFIPGLDVAGVVEKVGSEVKRFTEGQRVIAFPMMGSYAEYVAADEILTFPIPENVDFDTAAACPTVSFTAFKLLADIGRLEPGETVLIHAARWGGDNRHPVGENSRSGVCDRDGRQRREDDHGFRGGRRSRDLL